MPFLTCNFWSYRADFQMNKIDRFFTYYKSRRGKAKIT